MSVVSNIITAMGADPLGEPLAHGRDADVYALDARTVLRRYRQRDVPARETDLMRYVRERGYPAPEIVRVEGRDLVLERATGPTMAVDVTRRPWTLVRHARLLADLHRRLHAIAAPEWLPAIGPGGAVIHLDLHPENVMLHGDGALVIDWANARAGHWADDVAQTVVILAAADLPWRLRLAIRAFLAIYLAAFDRAVVRAHLPAAIERRMADPNMTARERELIPRVRI